MKSERWESPLASAHLVRSSKLSLTVFSNSRAASIASRQVPHSIVTGLAMSWKTHLLPLLLRLLGEVGGKPRQGLVVSREVGRHGEIDIGGVELHVDLLVDQSLTILMVVLPNLGRRHPHWRCAAVPRGGGTEALI